jgi:YD repeat-containing protein
MNAYKPVCTYNSKGKLIHYRNSDGREWWHEYDSNGKCIHSRESNGYEWWRKFDSDGKEIHYKTSTGFEQWFWEGKETRDPVKILLLASQIHSKAS